MKLKPVDIVAIIIIVTISFFIAGVVISFLNGVTMTEAKSKMLAGLLGSMLSIISMYVGHKLGGKGE